MAFVLFNLAAVAALVGIENPRYFTRVFKEMTGLSPAEYRSRIRSSGRSIK